MQRFQEIRRFIADEIVDLGVPAGALSREDMRRTRIISTTSLGIVLLVGLPFFVQFLRMGLLHLAALLALCASAAIANLVVLRARRKPRLAAHVGIGLFTTQLVVSNWYTGGFYDPNFSWLYLLPLGAAALIDMRGAALWTGITVAFTIGFWLLPDFGVVLVSQVPDSAREGHALFNRVSAIFGIGIIATSFVANQRRAERDLALANEHLLTETAYVQLLMHAAVAANEAQSFESAMRDSMRRICDTMGWVAGHVFTIDEEGDAETSGIGYARDAKLDALTDYVRSARYRKGQGMIGAAVTERKPQIVEQLAPTDDPNSNTSIAHRSGVRAAMAVPIYVNGAVPAVMLFASAMPLARTERLLEVFALIGAQLGKVAERTALQTRVQQSQKMEAVGQLAAGVAHEINNPMSYVRTNLHALREEWGELRAKLPGEGRERLDDFEELIDESLEGVERTISIVRDVREFSHRGAAAPEDWQDVDLAELVDSAHRVVAPQAPAGVRIEAHHDGDALCRCAPNQIRQVLVNLIVNAIQAVGVSGEIRLSTGRDGGTVFARVEDDGPGMSEAVRVRLFDPFFTTKPVGEGTGLGLSVSYEIVRNHRGQISVQSEPGAGACFEVRLPGDDPPTDRQGPQRANAGPPS